MWTNWDFWACGACIHVLPVLCAQQRLWLWDVGWCWETNSDLFTVVWSKVDGFCFRRELLAPTKRKDTKSNSYCKCGKKLEQLWGSRYSYPVISKLSDIEHVKNWSLWGKRGARTIPHYLTCSELVSLQATEKKTIKVFKTPGLRGVLCQGSNNNVLFLVFDVLTDFISGGPCAHLNSKTSHIDTHT